MNIFLLKLQIFQFFFQNWEGSKASEMALDEPELMVATARWRSGGVRADFGPIILQLDGYVWFRKMYLLGCHSVCHRPTSVSEIFIFALLGFRGFLGFL